MISKIRLFVWVLGVVLAVGVGISPPVSADFAMSGVWYGNRGNTFNIPNLGGFDLQVTPKPTVDFHPVANSADWVQGPYVRHQKHGIPTIAVPDRADAALPAQWGARGTGVIPGAQPGVGASFVIPGKLISQLFLSTVAIPGNPVVQQVDTQFFVQAPITSRNSTSMGGQAPIASQTRKMQPNAWSGAGQVSRLNANFTHTETTGAGVISRLARYTAGPNAFGGTMSMLISGSGGVWVGPRELVPQLPGNEFLLSPLGATVNAASPQGPGKAYAGINDRLGGQGVIYGNYAIQSPCVAGVVPASPPGCGHLKGPLPAGGSGISFTLAFLPMFTANASKPYFPYTQMLPTTHNLGWPFTTGHVSMYAKGTQGGLPQTSTLTAVGGDTTAGGVRTVQLVAGTVSLRNNPAQGGLGRTAGMDAVTITLPEPTSTLMLAGTLGLIGGLFGLRRRFF